MGCVRCWLLWCRSITACGSTYSCYCSQESHPWPDTAAAISKAFCHYHGSLSTDSLSLLDHWILLVRQWQHVLVTIEVQKLEIAKAGSDNIIVKSRGASEENLTQKENLNKMFKWVPLWKGERSALLNSCPLSRISLSFLFKLQSDSQAPSDSAFLLEEK